MGNLEGLRLGLRVGDQPEWLLVGILVGSWDGVGGMGGRLRNTARRRGMGNG